ncbi:hypothetical protein N0V82_002748 [Gnomoniopsis sp. IMI 355080]|nr:hypothetical protein N0V82_002748 [Gnomoniopsis sp. IMI 355080]
MSEHTVYEGHTVYGAPPSGPMHIRPGRIASLLDRLRPAGLEPSKDKPIGRWGYRLFEADADLDIAIEINEYFCDEETVHDDERAHDMKLSQMVHQSDPCTPRELIAHYNTAGYKLELAEHVDLCREYLDSGSGWILMHEYRHKENWIHPSGFNRKYMIIILGALMMRAGAKIDADDMKHLRELVWQVNCSDGKCATADDWGFRAPGKVQFLAALDNYKTGVPRSFQEPSCFTCGKIASDIKKALMKCSKCDRAWYCDRYCQKSDWSAHKDTCIESQKRNTINV